MGKLERFDQRVARVEGAIAVAVLLGMVVVASLQALFFNIAEHDISWARAALDAMSWSDAFLQKGTLWVAFLGASLATQKNKHIAIDLLPRLAPQRISAILRVFAAFGAGIIAFVLAKVFFQACLIADQAIPFDYEALTRDGQVIHICDAAPDIAEKLGRPAFFCALRAGFTAIHIPVSSGEGMAQLITPLMFVAIGIRLIARSISIVIAHTRGVTLKADDAHGPGTPPKEEG